MNEIQQPKKEWYKKWWVWLIIILGSGLIFGGDDENSTSKSKKEELVELSPQDMTGTYKFDKLGSATWEITSNGMLRSFKGSVVFHQTGEAIFFNGELNIYGELLFRNYTENLYEFEGNLNDTEAWVLVGSNIYILEKIND